MPKPKVVIFDLGKVLLDFDYTIAARKLATRTRLAPEEVKRHLDYSPLLFRYETGLMSSEEFYREICAATGYGGDYAEFGSCFGGIFAAIEPMVELHATLREHGVPTYIFSNTNELAVRHVRANFPFFANFTGYIFSYEHGVMKPDAKIYEVAEQQAGKTGTDILYLDDRSENVSAGAARGWQVILHEDPSKTRAQLRQLGMLNSTPPGA